jgi:hypothetical protein
LHEDEGGVKPRQLLATDVDEVIDVDVASLWVLSDPSESRGCR